MADANNQPIEVQDPTLAHEEAPNPYASLKNQRIALNAQMQKMIDSLDTRKNQLFDPTLLRVAAGFLKPTKTGSFGESLGYAAEEGANAQELEAKKNQELQKLKLDLEMQKYGLAKQEAGSEFLKQAMGDTGAPVTATVGADGTAAAIPAKKAPINFSKLIGAAASAGDTETVKMLTQMQEAQTRDIVNTPNGPFSISKNAYVEPLEGTVNREIAKTTAVERTKADIENNKKQEETLTLRQGTANDAISNAQEVLNFATNPDTAGAFGILAKPGAKSAFFNAIKDPIRVKDFSIGIGNVEDVLRVKNGTQAEIDAAKAVARNISNLELAFSQVFKGQGQVSDNERLIVRNVGPSLSDSPKVAALKAESIIARARFDELNAQNYDKWLQKNPNGLYKTYQNSTEFKQLQTQYNDKLGEVLTKYGFKAAATPKPVSSGVSTGSLESIIRGSYGNE